MPSRLLILLALLPVSPVRAEDPPTVDEATRARNTATIHEFLRLRTERITEAALADVETLEDWQRVRPTIRQRMFEMLGLWPMPERTPLQPTVTGTVEGEGFVVEKLHFQSRPGLYVTANFYRPTTIPDGERLPTVLYLCGHGRVKEDGVSYGNKVHYQHHPAWFARNGYCCLVIDTLQLGEIEGVHHGTYRMGRWWWHARGFTPAGVEAWNSIRAIDYLETRSEVDAKRIGVTGRSGGGTGTWWLAALDDRPACLVPVAGIVDYESHVVDGCITGHCDCNYFPNRYGVDASMYAVLAAPRPLLLSNTDKDRIFPLDGVVRIHDKLRKIYALYGAEDKLGLLITEGPHQDTQQLRVPAFKWMNRWLRETDEPITSVAEKFFEIKELRVLPAGGEPKDERNTSIDETFVPAAETPPVPSTRAEWGTLRKIWLDELRERSFAAWPEEGAPLDVKVVAERVRDGVRVTHLEYTSEDNLRFPLYVVRSARRDDAKKLIIDVTDDERWPEMRTGLHGVLGDGGAADSEDEATSVGALKLIVESQGPLAVVTTRGIGPNAWTNDEREGAQLVRRFFVVGRSPDEGRIWDVRRALRVLAEREDTRGLDIVLHGRGPLAGVALYAGLFEPGVDRFELDSLPASHRDGPILIDVLRILDLPQAVALAYPRPVTLHRVDADDWRWPRGVAGLYDRPNLLTIRPDADK